MYPKQQASGFYGAEIGNVAGVGNQGGADQISQRVYGPIEKGMHNRPKYGRLTTPDVYMAPYPYTPPGEPQELFPLGGNSRTGFRFEAGLPSRGEMLLAQSPSGGFQNIGNVGGMLGGEIGDPAPNVFSMRPRIGYDEQGLDVGGSMNVPIGKDGRVQFTGGYRPDSSKLNLKGTIGQPPGSQGLGIDFYVNKILNKKPEGNDIGVEARYSTQF